MTSQENSKSEKYSRLGEQVFISAILLNSLVILAGYEYKPLTYFLIAGLAIVYFLSAFQPPKFISTENEQFGFSELFTWTILPKVLLIATSVVITGILLFYMDLGNSGYQKLLTIGCSTLLISLFLLTVLAIKGVKQLNVLVPTVYRTLPYLLGGIFILYYFADSKLF